MTCRSYSLVARHAELLSEDTTLHLHNEAMQLRPTQTPIHWECDPHRIINDNFILCCHQLPS